jgi:hypothetical protein
MSGIHTPEAESIRAGLIFVPAYDRDLWLRIGMAIKSEPGEQGFDLWSQQDESYREADARDVWKCIRVNGRVQVPRRIAEYEGNGEISAMTLWRWMKNKATTFSNPSKSVARLLAAFLDLGISNRA